MKNYQQFYKRKQVNHWQKPERNVYYQYLD